MIVEGWLGRAVAARPTHTALQTPAGSWSYAQLHNCASAGAGQLAALGAGPGTRVAIVLPSGLAFAQALHACLLLGAVAVPIDLRLSAPERERITGGCEVVLDEPLALGGDVGLPAGAGRTHELDAVAVVIHTSGTTSAPKPVELTYGNLLWSALGSAVALGLEEDERWLCTLPLSHVGGLSILLRSAIYATTALLHARFETDRVLHALREERVTLVSLVATTLARLLDAGLEGGAAGQGPTSRAPLYIQPKRPPALRCALTGGGPVPPALVARARAAGVPISLTYGLTEACSQVTTTPVAALDELPTHLLTAGPPLFCTRVQTSTDGEIMVAGPTVAPGSADGEGWLRTGDLGVIGEDGRLHVTGRKAEVIVSGGENVAPAEVEAVLESHPDVAEAAVVGRSDPEWGEAVTAIVVAAPGSSPDEDRLRAHCASQLAAFKVPKQVSFISEPLPRTRSGKLLRRELR